METSVRILADSIGPSKVRLVSAEMTFPRFILPEKATHRAFSKSAASTRAIPISKQIERVLKDPVVPRFGKNCSGMQSFEWLSDEEQAEAEKLWLEMLHFVAKNVGIMADPNGLNIHKQWSGRPLEPWMWAKIICTADQDGWANFFALRDHKDAQPEMQTLARCAKEAMNASVPRVLKFGEWHMPFISEADSEFTVHQKLKLSAGRCARVSYLNHNGVRDPQADFALFEKLVLAEPMHSNPLEHQAKAVANGSVRSGNFRGWRQLRKIWEAGTFLFEANDHGEDDSFGGF